MKIEIKYSSSENDNTRTKSLTLNDLGYDQQDWDAFSEREKEEIIQLYVDGFDQPYYVVESFNIQ